MLPRRPKPQRGAGDWRPWHPDRPPQFNKDALALLPRYTGAPTNEDYYAWIQTQPEWATLKRGDISISAVQQKAREAIAQSFKDDAQRPTDEDREAGYRKRFGPVWDTYNERNKAYIRADPFYQIIGKELAKRGRPLGAILPGLQDPIIQDGLKAIYTFLVEGGVEIAKALLTGRPQDALAAIAKKAAPGFMQAFTASRQDPTPLALKLREVAEEIAGHEGKGVLADVYATLTGSYPGEKDFMTTIRQHASKRILTMYAMRTPINSVYQALIGAVSQGRFNEELKAKGYDQAMHLGLVVLLSDGTRLLLEKNERVKATTNPTTSPTTQDLAVPLGGKVLTLGDLIGNTLTAVGSKQYFSYSPAPSGNCQRWCVDVLRSSGLLTPQLEGWILQDVGTAVKQLPWFTEHLLDAVALVGRGGMLHRTITGDHRYRRSRNSHAY